ncbi:MAG: helix-hairpin-helix domain-containing protein [Ginsengibacter sp.]
MWKQFAKDYLTFSRKERLGIIILIFGIVILTLLPNFFSYFITEKKYETDSFKKELARLKIDSSDRRDFNKKKFSNYVDYSKSNSNAQPINAVLFYFDPNKATEADWIKLGVREKTALTIQKYISKGGKFRTAEDLKKVYGLNKLDVDRLVPFVKIEEPENKYASFEKKENTNAPFSYKPRTIVNVDINLADTTAYIALPGIGSKLSLRIISFRDKLGGFYSIEQVAETFLLPDSTFLKIKPFLVLSNMSVRKININTALLDELKAHPYIRYTIAKVIVEYRNQHGNFTTVEQLKKINLITEEIFQKVKPYLTVE